MEKEKYIDDRFKKDCAECGATFFRDKRNTYKYWSKAKFCSRICSSKSGARKMVGGSEKIKSRFFTNIVKVEGGCWSWVGTTRPDGRGYMSVRGKRKPAHHLSLEIHNRPLPDGKIACHTCNNKNCVNPDHLYHGTHAENSRDAVLAGAIHWRKLTKDQVISIRKSTESIRVLSDRYGVSPAAIAKVIKRITWKHV